MQRLIRPALYLLCMLAGAPLAAQQVHPFSARQTADYALKNSVQVRNALIDVAIQQQSNREITASAFPQLSGSANLTNYLSLPTNLLPGEFFGRPAGTFIPVKFGTKFNGSYTANLRQIIFDGQVFVGLQARRSAITLSEQTGEVTQNEIKANVYKVYYQIVVGKTQTRIIDANIARAEKLLHDTKELFKNGFQEQLDVDKVNVNLSNLRTQKTSVENQLETGTIALKYLIGMPVKEQLVLTDSLDDQQLKDDLLTGSFKYDDRPEYRLQQTAAKLGQFNVKRYQLSYYPTLSFNGTFNRNAQRNKFNFFDKNQSYFTTGFISFDLSIPIFDGFAKAARIQQARLQLQQTQLNISNLENSIDNDVQTARIQIRNAISTMDEQKSNMALATQVYDQTKKKYEQGLGSNLEIANAEADLVTSQNNYFSAVYDAIIARIDYLKAVGKL